MVVDPVGQAGQVLMSGALVSGIPHAFVVDSEGVVQYHGHPASPEFERAVQKVCVRQRLCRPASRCILVLPVHLQEAMSRFLRDGVQYLEACLSVE